MLERCSSTLGHCFYRLSSPTMVITMSTPQEKRSPPFQMRLNEDFRLQLENEMRKDGDNALASWIKRILRKELQLRGIEPKG